jgi:hypothetical protein
MTPDGAWVLSGSSDKGVHFWDAHTGISQLIVMGHQHSVLSVATSPLLTPKGGLFATASGDKEAKIWSYVNVVPQRVAQFGTLGNRQIIPKAQPSPQIFQHHELRLPIQEASTVVNHRPVTPRQIVPRNFQPQPQSALALVGPSSQYTNINQRGSPGRIQQSSQPPSTPGDLPKIATEAVEISNTHQAAIPPEEGLEVNTQSPVTNSRLESVAKDSERETLSWLNLLNNTYKFALQGPQSLPQRFQKLYALKDSLPRDEEALQAHQEQVDKMKDKIRRLEALYHDLLEHVPEEDRGQLLLMKEKTAALKQHHLEELDKQREKALRVVRDNKADTETLAQLFRGLKTRVPELIKALQELEAYIVQLPDV